MCIHINVYMLYSFKALSQMCLLTWSDFQSMLNEKSKMQNSVHISSPVPEMDSGHIYVLSTLKVCRRIHK